MPAVRLEGTIQELTRLHYNDRFPARYVKQVFVARDDYGNVRRPRAREELVVVWIAADWFRELGRFYDFGFDRQERDGRIRIDLRILVLQTGTLTTILRLSASAP